MGRLVTEDGVFVLTTESGVILITEGYVDDGWAEQDPDAAVWSPQSSASTIWTVQTPGAADWEIS